MATKIFARKMRNLETSGMRKNVTGACHFFFFFLILIKHLSQHHHFTENRAQHAFSKELKFKTLLNV